MRVTKHPLPKQIIHNYSIHNQVLENVSSAEYYEITVTDDLDWGQHINNVTSKATKTLGFLLRNLTLAPKETKVAAYKALGLSLSPSECMLKFSFFPRTIATWNGLTTEAVSAKIVDEIKSKI